MRLHEISFFLVIAAAQAALPLPPFLKKCTTREPAALNACAEDNARRTVAAIAATGDRKYGVAPFDPAFIEKLAVEQSGFLLEFTNMTISTLPLGSWHIDSVDLNLDKRYIHFRYSTPTLVLKSNYRIQGRILLVYLKGAGDCEVRYDKAALEIANQNWKEIYEDTKESTEEAFGLFVNSVLQSVFNLVPYKDVFPQ